MSNVARRAWERIGAAARSRVWLFVPFLAVLSWAVFAFARAGGGHSYSGGGSSGGGGGGYGGGGGDGIGGRLLFELVWFLVRFTIRYPLVGIPLDLLVIFTVWHLFFRSRPQTYVSGTYGRETLNVSAPPRSAEARTNRYKLEQLRALDPGFSYVAFADFTYSLFAEVHHARGTNKLANYSGYISDEALKQLSALTSGLKTIEGVIVGAWHLHHVGPLNQSQVTIQVQYEANYTETTASGRQSWYTNETWTLVRDINVLSKSPEQMKSLGCPNCGASLKNVVYRACSSCGQVVGGGSFNWFVSRIETNREQRPPLLTSGVEEVGTSLPTLRDADLLTSLAKYQAAHPEFSMQAFLERAKHVFVQIQNAWTEQRWELARPYESDRLFESHLYWIQEYKRQGLRNVLKNVKIQSIVPASLHQDKYFTSLTVRIYASMIDTTVDRNGERLSGDARHPRAFSEYWTFIKGTSSKIGGVKPIHLCPSCGADLKIGMAGTCSYCAAKITTGDFDWVLSFIEQDESYGG